MTFLSRMGRLWDSIVWRSYEFSIPERKLPAARVRAMRLEDMPACREIYRLNEPKHFPAEYFDHFLETLSSERVLFLVVEEGHAVIGFGGVALHPTGRPCASLSFGMVHPDFQRRGIGTILLLARIAILPPNKVGYVLSVVPIPNSQSFYRKFDFGFVKTIVDKYTKVQFDQFAVLIGPRGLQKIRSKLEQSAVIVQVSESIPQVPAEIVGERWTKK